MKQSITILLVIAAILSMAACQGTQPDSSLQEPFITEPTTGTTSSTGSTTTSSTEPAPCQHEYEVIQQDPTCTETGLKESTCYKCGDSQTKELTATGHDFLEATCTEAGICRICGKTTGQPLGHDYGDRNEKCIRCGTVPPAPDCTHSFQISEQIQPGCTDSGSTTYTCSTCGYHYTQTTNATGHNYADANCLLPKTCSLCSATSGTALGHSYGTEHLCIRCGVEDPNKPADNGNFTVTVRNKSSQTIPNITVTVYVNDNLIGSARTDSKGKATISVPLGCTYTVILSDVPAGYSAKDSYNFTSLTANINLTTTPVLNPNDHSKGQYKVGSTMADFTLTDTDGVTYNLYSLLETKKVVILNFWYVNCGPCKAEFPYFEELYQQYSDDIQFLALDHFDSESQIRDLKAQMELTFPMIRENLNMQAGFGLKEYPTTVVIGQGGRILLIHTGTYSYNQVLNLFETYS